MTADSPFPDRAALAPVVPADARRRARPLDEERYVSLREIVTGSSVFQQVWDRETGQTVGLKRVSRAFLARLERRYPGLPRPSEGAILAAISHPRVVRVCEYGDCDGGGEYLVMEFLPGETLASFLRREAPLAARLNLIQQAATALSAVHAAGFLHRDIAPGNFIVAPDGGSLTLIDFGLSLPRTAEFLSRRNRLGMVAYLAPETVRREPIDQRVDVYALGVTAYETLTTALPTRAARDDNSVLLANLQAVGTPPTVADAILRCMSQRVGERPSDLTPLLASLADCALRRD